MRSLSLALDPSGYGALTRLPTGTKVAGHRGYYLMDVGVDLNQALISYGLSFLRSKEYKKVQPPFFMNKAMMGKTAQLEEFDEALYKVRRNGCRSLDVDDSRTHLSLSLSLSPYPR